MSRKTIKNPITGLEQAPADLLAEAQKGTPYSQLTQAERDEFAGLSDTLQDKLAGIAHAAMVAHSSLNSDSCDPADGISQDDAADVLDSIFGDRDRDDVTV